MQFENSYQISTDIQRLLEIRNPLVVQATLDQIRKRVAPLSEEEREELFWQARDIVRRYITRHLAEIDRHPMTQVFFHEATVLLNSGVPSHVPMHNTTPIEVVSKHLNHWLDQLQSAHSPEEVFQIIHVALSAAGSFPATEQQLIGRTLICSRIITQLLNRYLDLFEHGVLGSDLYLPSLLSTFESGFLCPMEFLSHLVYQPKLHAFTSTMGKEPSDKESQHFQEDTPSNGPDTLSQLFPPYTASNTPEDSTILLISGHINISIQQTTDNTKEVNSDD